MTPSVSVDPPDKAAEMHKLVQETNNEEWKHVDENEYACSQLFPELQGFHSDEGGDSADSDEKLYEINNQSKKRKFN